MGNLRKIEVNFEEIVLAIEDYKSLCTSYLDTLTGHIITLTENINEDTWRDSSYISSLPAWERSFLKDAQNIFTDENDKYLYIPKLNVCEEYEFMCDFTDTIIDDNIRLRLLNALDGDKAFKEFKKVLNCFPELVQEWYEFREKEMYEYVVDFMNENGFEPVQKIIS